MGQMDQGFKAWFDLCKADVVPFVTDDPQAQYLGDIPTEIAAEPQLLPDSLYRVRSQGIEHILNIEVQSYPDATMDRRLYEYGVRANLAYKLPVKSVVLWLFRQRGKRVPKPPYKIYIGNELETLWNFTNIELYTLPASAIIKATAVGLMPVVPFTQGAGQEIVEAAMRRVREEAPAQQAEQLAALLGLFTTRFHGEAFALGLVRRYFMSTEILQEFPLFRSMMAEAEAKGEAKGMRAISMRILEERFGPLSQDVIDALNGADVPTLSELAVHLSADSLEQLSARLGLPGQPLNE